MLKIVNSSTASAEGKVRWTSIKFSKPLSQPAGTKSREVRPARRVCEQPPAIYTRLMICKPSPCLPLDSHNANLSIQNFVGCELIGTREHKLKRPQTR